MNVRSQTYARNSYRLVNALLTTLQPEEQKRYGGLCHTLPLMIREQGLATTFGYLQAKGSTEDAPETLLLQHYAQLLGAPSGPDLYQTVINANFTAYRRLTLHALAAAEWFKRYAESVLKVDASGNDATETTEQTTEPTHD